MARDPKSRDWCWTLNNPQEAGRWTSPEHFMQRIRDAYPKLTYMVFCLEVGESKTPHWQGYFQFQNAVSRNKLNTVTKGAHLEPAKGKPQQAVDYIKRTGAHADKPGLLEGPWEWGELEGKDQQGKRTDLAEMLDLHLEMGGGFQADAACARRFGTSWVRYGNKTKERSRLILMFEGNKMRDKPEIHWYFGPTGTGKTRRVWELEGTGIDTVTLSGDIRSPFFNGLYGQEVLLLDDLRPDQIHFAYFLRVLDRYPMVLNTKGTWDGNMAKRIYVTSQLSPVEFAAACGGVAEDPTQLTRRIDKVVDFNHVHAAQHQPEVVEVTDEELEEPVQKRPRLERHGAMSHLEEEVLVVEAQEGRTPRTLQEIIDREEAREDSGDDADFEED